MDKVDIINCALRLFHQKGYNATSMGDIADELGIKKPSLYYHIKCKQELLHVMIEEIGLRLVEKVKYIDRAGGNIYEKLQNAIYAHTLTCLKNVEYTSIIHDEIKSLDPDQRKVVEKVQEDYLRIFRNMFDQGIKAGLIIDFDANMLTHIVLGMGTWGYKWFKQDRRYSPEEMASLITNLAMKAISNKEISLTWASSPLTEININLLKDGD